jgi:predicted DNA-binding transcriptional regulator AlpA
MTVSAPIETTPPVSSVRRLIDAREVGRLFGCSWRHVLRLDDEGKIPWGCKLGRLRRWDSLEIEKFIGAGCPAQRG